MSEGKKVTLSREDFEHRLFYATSSEGDVDPHQLTVNIFGPKPKWDEMLDSEKGKIIRKWSFNVFMFIAAIYLGFMFGLGAK